MNELFVFKGDLLIAFSWFTLFLIASLAGSVAVYLANLKKSRDMKKAYETLKIMNEQMEEMNERIRNLYSELQISFKRFQDVMELASNATTFESSEEEFFEKVLYLASQLVPKATYGSISFLEGENWKFVAAIGHDYKKLRNLNLKKEYAMVNLERTTVIHDIMKKNEGIIPLELLREMSEAVLPIKSTILAPIKLGDRLVGFFALDIPKESSEEFEEKDLEIVDKFARIISGFYAARKYLEIEGKLHKGVVLTLVKALEYHDPYTRGHSERVAKMAADLAERMGLPRSRIKITYWAGLVHDIGKIYVPQSILAKPEKLTDEEYEKVKEHPVKGYEMLKETEGLEEIAKIVLHHHERCDGKGYPGGLRCDEIPIESRIISVVDAFDAMTSARAYREPLTFDEAILEILKGSGTQFDPDATNVFIDMMKRSKKVG